MTVRIRYRTLDITQPTATLEVPPDDPSYGRARWLAEPGPTGEEIDCTVDRIPDDARVGEGQDPLPYYSPCYADTPSVERLLDDEERRRRFVAQAREVAAWLRAEGRQSEGARFRRLAVVALLAGLLGCAAAPALDGAEQAAAAEALAAGRMLAEPAGEPLAGYVIRAGELVLWTLPAAEPGPAPEGAVARYDVATGRVTPLRGDR